MANQLTDITISEVSLVDAPANKGARVMLFKREFSDDQRKELAGTGAALPDGSFPISNKGDLANAIHAFGRAKNKAEAKAHIVSRAKTLGASDMIPDNWAKRDRSQLPPGKWVAPIPGNPIAKDGDGDEPAALFDDVVEGDAADEAAEGYAKPICEAIHSANCALYDSISSILEDDEVADKQAMLKETFQQYGDHVQEAVSKVAANISKQLTAASDDAASQKKDSDMTKEEFAKALADEVAKVTAPLNETIAKLGDENAILKMSDKHKAYMDSSDMSDEAKKKFAAKSADERDAHMAKSAKPLPDHVQKALVENDELKKRLAVLEEKDALGALQKRATDAGLPVEFGEVLQKAERGDKAAIATMVEKFGELNKSRDAIAKTGGIFKEFGTSRGATGDAYSQLSAKADELRKAEPALSQAKAFAKVYADPSNRELVVQEKTQRMNKAANAAA